MGLKEEEEQADEIFLYSIFKMIVRNHHAQNDPRGAAIVPGVWMCLVALLSFATIIVVATNS